VLNGPNSKSVPDADLGLIYQFPHNFQAGLAILHAAQPNVAFSGTDKLQREINLGLAYKSLWTSVMGELKDVPSPTGSGTDEDAIVAAERYFPTADYGQFGVRGSAGLSLNNSDWKELTVGAAYRVNKIQFDYAFLIPVGGVQGQSGSHRVSLTFYFGAPNSEEETGRALLDQARKTRRQGPDYGYEYSSELKPADLSDPRLADVRRMIDERQYGAAQKALSELGDKQALSEALVRLSNRLTMVASHYTELSEPKTALDMKLADALRRFFYGEDRLAMLELSYVFSQRPDDAALGRLLDDTEKAVGIKATRLSAGSPRGFIDAMLDSVEYANTRGDTARVETTLADVLFLEPQNVTALERLGTMRYLAGRMPEAIAAWEAAAKLETRPGELESLRAYLRSAYEKLPKPPPPGGSPATQNAR
jgi:hypothetical protein